MTGRHPAVFLDRDGVLNEAIVRNGNPYSPSSLEEVRIAPEARAACSQLRMAGLTTVMVTNQPEVARGTITLQRAEMICQIVAEEVGIDAVRMCPHDDGDHCGCRKPAPGMLLDAAENLYLDLEASYLVGDRWNDVEAGRQAGVRTALLQRKYGNEQAVVADFADKSLLTVVEWIISSLSAERAE